MSDRDAKQQIVQIVRELFDAGHLTSTGGNVSNLSADGETIWITPTGRFKGRISEDSLVRIRSDGSVVEGSSEPSIEFRMHFRAYEARPETRGAVHTHSPVATAFGICNQSFDPINTDAVALADTATVPWFMPGSAELADGVFEALKVSRGAILQNHGLISVGEDLRKAATRAAMIEETAKIALYVKQFGGNVSYLPEEGIASLGPITDFL